MRPKKTKPSGSKLPSRSGGGPGARAVCALTLDTRATSGPIDFRCYGLGQAGLSDNGMIDDHVEALRNLRPQIIRLPLQEYYRPYPDHGVFNWKTFDHDLEVIRATGAGALISLCFKPPVLFPRINPETVDPNDYDEWEFLIGRMVRHCNFERNFGVRYWEIGNAGDIGEEGGSPYAFSPRSFLTYYTHTVRAIRAADPDARVGGPGLARYDHPIGDALIEYCGQGHAPLDFFSWHAHAEHPDDFRRGIRHARERLSSFAGISRAETVIGAWNLSRTGATAPPSFHPAFILESTMAFHEEGLNRSAYFHIRDRYVDPECLGTFLSNEGAAAAHHRWNVTPSSLGLWDVHGHARPAYQTFKLLSLLAGEKLDVSGCHGDVRVLACRDTNGWARLIAWHWPSPTRAGGAAPAIEVALSLRDLRDGEWSIYKVNTSAMANDLELVGRGRLNEHAKKPLVVMIDPYAIFWIELQDTVRERPA